MDSRDAAILVIGFGFVVILIGVVMYAGGDWAGLAGYPVISG